MQSDSRSIDQSFLDAAERVKQLPYAPNNNQKLHLYSLYKQGLFGDNTTQKPSFYDIRGNAKWNAWNEKKGLQQQDAKKQYIDLVDQLFNNVPK